jgi:hypothetical protein
MKTIILNKLNPTSGRISKLFNRFLDFKILKGTVSIEWQGLFGSITNTYSAGTELKEVNLADVVNMEFRAATDAEVEYFLYP